MQNSYGNGICNGMMYNFPYKTTSNTVIFFKKSHINQVVNHEILMFRLRFVYSK